MIKDQLRKDFLSKLRALSNDQVNSLSIKVTHQLISFLASHTDLVKNVGGSFLPLRAEVYPVLQELMKYVPVKLAYPVLVDGNMHFGIPEVMPRGASWLEPPYSLTEPSWLLVPGLGFDFKGARLGRGKGYYDRYLQKKDVIKIGIAWSEQILTKIPVEQHDAQMDFIITESFCWSVAQQEKF
jgi:5-formyltetrahydrofolate cyclo-ligase